MTYRSEKNSRFQAVFAGEKSFKIVLRIPKRETLCAARIFCYYNRHSATNICLVCKKLPNMPGDVWAFVPNLRVTTAQNKRFRRCAVAISGVDKSVCAKIFGYIWQFPDFFVPLHRFPRSRWQEKSSGLFMLRWGRQTILFTKDGRSN